MDTLVDFVAGVVRWVETVELPSAGTSAILVLLSYFLVTAGVAYDMINEPPAVGATQDPVTGKYKPQAFMPYRASGQYIMEGILGAVMYMLGGIALIALLKYHDKQIAAKYRNMLLYFGLASLVLSYLAVTTFIRIKMPSYLH